MPTSLHVHFLPTLMDQDQLTGGVAVIIDILRASSTITTALANGARCVVPCATPEDARALQLDSRFAGQRVLLGGERGGVQIDGFDFGNSPAEYTPNKVQNAVVGFTTTNGTRALLMSARSERILIGCFLNHSAVVSELLEMNSDPNHSVPLHLVCAGTDGCITGEDVFFAGSVVESLTEFERSTNRRWTLNDSSEIAREYWRQGVAGHTLSTSDQDSSRQIEQVLRRTHGGRNLRHLGYESDIQRCSQLNQFDCVPEYDSNSGQLILK